jgi:hypothetical protein
MLRLRLTNDAARAVKRLSGAFGVAPHERSSQTSSSRRTTSAENRLRYLRWTAAITAGQISNNRSTSRSTLP